MNNIYLNVTDERIKEIQKVIDQKEISLEVKVWFDKDDRDMGNPIYHCLDNPTDLYDAIYNPVCEYFRGGCMEVITEDTEHCIYHSEDAGDYLYAPGLYEIGVVLDEDEEDEKLCQEVKSW